MTNTKTQEIDDPVAFLTALRQAYWRGQSYDEMYDQLSKLLVAKIWAERTGVVLTAANADILWQAAYANFKLQAVGDFFTYNDDRLELTIAMLSRWQISGDHSLWHVMHRAWLRHHVKRDCGQYYTPEFIKRFMVSVYPPGVGMRICDPCAGSGGFLLEAATALDIVDPSLFYYFDIDAGQTIKSARMILALYTHQTGLSLAGINMEVRNSLAGNWPCQMDRVYTNVPFGIRVTRQTLAGTGPLIDLYQTGLGKQSELSQVLFIEQCLRHLAPGGCFATVVDKGVVTNEKLMGDRAKLLQDGRYRLQLVVELPGVAFEYVAGTTFQTYLLFFSTADRSTDRTYFARIINPGYDESGYVVAGRRLAGFPVDISTDAWATSDWPATLAAFAAGTLPSAPHADVATGDWHLGPHLQRRYQGQRLSDVADLVNEPWPGTNCRNPTVDRRYHIVTETHLDPAKKQRTLRTGCLFMSRLISVSQPPAAGVITDDFDGAGCTNENYIIRPRCINDLVRLWYLINFDYNTWDYLRQNARGQGRSRVLERDLLLMPVPLVAPAMTKRAASLLRRLLNKATSDLSLAIDITAMTSDNQINL